jgi:hypothetical protein
MKTARSFAVALLLIAVVTLAAVPVLAEGVPPGPTPTAYIPTSTAP